MNVENVPHVNLRSDALYIYIAISLELMVEFSFHLMNLLSQTQTPEL